jgi:O-antigen ligase
VGPPADIAQALKKYAKLLMLPVAITLCLREPALARRTLTAYAGGSALLALSCYLVWLGAMPASPLGWWRVGDARDAFAFKNHITLGILLGFSAVAGLLMASYSERTRTRLGWIAAALFAAVPVMFLNQGRTGYLAVLVGLVALLVLRVRLTPLRAVAGLGAIALLFVGLYATSTNFRSRTGDLITEVRTGQVTSPNGMRISFLFTGLHAVADRPLTGNGTGSFAELHAPAARAIWGAGTPMGEVRNQPHSEFLLIAVQLGLPGLALYLALLAAFLRPATRVRSPERDLLVLLWVVYVFCSLFNSLLWDPTEASWFLMLAGTLYAATWRQAATSSQACSNRATPSVKKMQRQLT